MDIKSPQKVLHIFSRALENFSSFGFVKGGLVCRTKPNVLKCAAGKKKIKMRVGKNFKNIQVGLSVGSLFSVSLLKNAFKSVNLNCQVAKSLFFSRHFQGCTVFLRLGITVWRLAKKRISKHKASFKH